MQKHDVHPNHYLSCVAVILFYVTTSNLAKIVKLNN